MRSDVPYRTSTKYLTTLSSEPVTCSPKTCTYQTRKSRNREPVFRAGTVPAVPGACTALSDLDSRHEATISRIISLFCVKYPIVVALQIQYVNDGVQQYGTGSEEHGVPILVDTGTLCVVIHSGNCGIDPQTKFRPDDSMKCTKSINLNAIGSSVGLSASENVHSFFVYISSGRA